MSQGTVTMPQCLLLVTAILVVATSDLETRAQSGGARSKLVIQYCVRCHGETQPKGGFSLHQLETGSVRAAQAPVWRKIYDKLRGREMPPAESKQPPARLRQAALLWIEREMLKAGQPIDNARWLNPSKGNWIDHDALFSGKSTGAAATRGRLWRLTGKAYEEFVQTLNVKYRLRFKTYGHSRVRAPWQLAPQKGLRDYATLHRIGESEIEHHLRNASRVARAMIAGLPRAKRNSELIPLKALLTSGATSTAAQVNSASRVAFFGILGRAPSKTELQRYAGFLSRNLKTLKAEKAVEQLLVAILLHPEVMYRIELPDAGAKRAMMSPRNLARSIAYSITDKGPDAALEKAVGGGRLATRAEIRAQVVRILNDKTIAKPRILRFFQEYFGHTRAIDVFKDSATRKAAGFRGRNDWHPNFFVSDADKLIEWVLARDKKVLYELLTTPKTFALTGNTKQALGRKKNPTKPFSLFAKTALDIYEVRITPKEWSDERPFEMPRAHRMGILTHPAWLIAHSTNFDNHAIDRGRWIRERLLGGRIPDIPVTVDAQLPDAPHHTLRQRMRVTRKNDCWKCHQYMDPLGLPFEQFDHFGRFRTTEMVVDRVATNKNVDKNGESRGPIHMAARLETSGAIAGSHERRLDGPVDGPFQLIRKLAASRRVEQVFVRYAFRYFVGRNETLADGPTLVAAHQAYRKSGGSMNALIASLLTSDAFLLRTHTVQAQPAQAERKKP